MKNIVYNSKLTAQGDIHVGDVYIIDGHQKTIHHNLTSLPYIDPKNIIGRKKELNDIHKLFSSNNQLVLVNGMGGIGKTTMAKYFLNKKRDDFSYVAYLDYQENAFQTFVNNIQLLDTLYLTEEVKTILKRTRSYKSAFELVTNRMRQLKTSVPNKPNLLIIDNVSKTDIETLSVLDKVSLSSDWKVLFTSRIKLHGLEIFYLDCLNQESALKLFSKYYNLENDRKKIIEIFDLIGYNTLLIELISKNSQILRFSLDDIIKNLKKKGLRFSNTESVKLNHSNNAPLNDINTYLLAIFTLAEITPSESLLLQGFSLLPSIFILYESKIDFSVSKIFQLKENQSNQTRIDLHKLCKKGWLIHDEVNDSFKIHELVQEVIYFKLIPDDVSHPKIIEALNDELDYWNLDFKRNSLFFTKRIVEKISGQTTLFGELVDNYAAVIHRFDRYEEAIKLQEKALKIKLKLLPEDALTIGHSYCTIGLCYNELGDYGLAEKYLLKDLNITLKNTNPDLFDLAISYNNLALVCKNIERLEEAMEYYKKAFEIAEKIDDTDLNKVIYGNIGNLHYILGDYAESLKFYNIEYDLLKTIGADELWISENEYNRAIVLIELNELEKALHLLDHSYSTYSKYSPDSVSIAYLHYGYGRYYIEKNSPTIAKEHFEIALEKFSKKLRQHNRWVKSVKQWIDKINNHNNSI